MVGLGGRSALLGDDAVQAALSKGNTGLDTGVSTEYDASYHVVRGTY
jgi:hypothetical protein